MFWAEDTRLPRALLGGLRFEKPLEMTMTLTEPKVQLAHVYGALQVWAASHLILAFLCFILQARNEILKNIYLTQIKAGMREV